MTRTSFIPMLLLSLMLLPFAAVTEPSIEVGRNLIIAVNGARLSAEQKALLEELRPGGVVLLGPNISNAEQTRKLVHDIKNAVSGKTGVADYPLIYIDQEGGRINRLRLNNARSAAMLGALGDASQARESGARFAREALSRGIGVILAPVLDLCPPEQGGVIGDRSFGASPELVWRMGQSFASGIIAGGALPVVKHFPGHGAAIEDSHIQLARLHVSGEELRTTLEPFRLAAAASIAAIMVGHIACAALDPENPNLPATLSHAVVTGLLREQWGYDGFIITDDLNMGAISDTLETAVVKSLRAGCDAAMVCDGNPQRLRRVARAVSDAARTDLEFARHLLQGQRRLEHFQWMLAMSAESAHASDDNSATQQDEPSTMRQHVVRRGDTLSKLGREYGVSLESIRRANGMSDDTVRIDEKILIPAE